MARTPGEETSRFVEITPEKLDLEGDMKVVDRDGTLVRIQPSKIDLSTFTVFEMDMETISQLRHLFDEMGGVFPITARKVQALRDAL